MRVLVLGANGYLGWPTAVYLRNRGHEVAIFDNDVKKTWETPETSPLWEIPKMLDRSRGLGFFPYPDDLCVYEDVCAVLQSFHPTVIIHYAEQPSAPYSMQSVSTASETQVHNVLGTLNLLWAMRSHCPDAHLVKLGSMGEYGTPNIAIEEGWWGVEHGGRRDSVLFPKKPGSFYHLSKVHDSHNIEFACRVWGLRATDLNQGVVYGLSVDEGTGPLAFHCDDVFGTVLNRFCSQAVVGQPLTVYGSGAQRRTFLNIRDTLRCVELACEHPARPGEFRIFNQFTEVFSIIQLAHLVRDAAEKLGLHVGIESVPNPRAIAETECHFYEPKAEALKILGLQPTLLHDTLLNEMLSALTEKKADIRHRRLQPIGSW